MLGLTLPPSSALGLLGFILYTFSHGPPTLLLFFSSWLLSFSVLFVALKRFPRPAAIQWLGQRSAMPPSTGKPKWPSSPR